MPCPGFLPVAKEGVAESQGAKRSDFGRNFGHSRMPHTFHVGLCPGFVLSEPHREQALAGVDLPVKAHGT
jgi:hypothetical protein